MSSFKIPAGSTGSALARSEWRADLRSFRAVIYEAARRTTGSVVSLASAGVTPNFHTAVIAYSDRQIAVLRHSATLMVAFASHPHAEEMAPFFVNDAALATAITELSELQVLTAEQLQTPVSRVDLSALTEDERRQIAYWNPGTVGEVLFNYWD